MKQKYRITLNNFELNRVAYGKSEEEALNNFARYAGFDDRAMLVEADGLGVAQFYILVTKSGSFTAEVED